MSKFNVSENCIKNRGFSGCADFIVLQSIKMIEKAIELNGAGIYELSFRKSLSIKPDPDDGHFDA